MNGNKIHYLLNWDSILSIGWRNPPKFNLQYEPRISLFYVNYASLADMAIAVFAHCMKSFLDCPHNPNCPQNVKDDLSLLIFDTPVECQQCLETIRNSSGFFKIAEYIESKFAMFLDVAPSGTKYFYKPLGINPSATRYSYTSTLPPDAGGLRQIRYVLNAIFSNNKDFLAELINEPDNLTRVVTGWYDYLRGEGTEEVEPDAVLNIVSNLPVTNINHVIPSIGSIWKKPTVVTFS